MSHAITIEVSDRTLEILRGEAASLRLSTESIAAERLQRSVENAALTLQEIKDRMTPEERRAAIQRFEKHIGSVSLDDPTNADNEQIDADLVRQYGDSHESR